MEKPARYIPPSAPPMAIGIEIAGISVVRQSRRKTKMIADHDQHREQHRAFDLGHRALDEGGVVGRDRHVHALGQRGPDDVERAANPLGISMVFDCAWPTMPRPMPGLALGADAGALRAGAEIDGRHVGKRHAVLHLDGADLG